MITDELAPVFQSRETRMGNLPEAARTKLTLASESAKASGQTDFEDQQFASLWLSRRTGLPRKDVLANFNQIAGNYFGEGTTAAGAYDKISATYKDKPVEGQTLETDQLVEQESTQTESLPKAGKDGLMVNVEQSARSFSGGFATFAQQIPAGIFSQAAAATGVNLKTPEQDPEFMDLKRQSERFTDPYKFTQVYDEAQSYGPYISSRDEETLKQNEGKMQAIRQRIDEENRASLREWKNSYKGEISQGYRDTANFWYELSGDAMNRAGVNPEFQKTTLGQFMQSAGSVPASAALAALGPAGIAGLESTFFAQTEAERMQAEGSAYDPQKAFKSNLASAVPQMIVERAFGVERLMNNVLKEVPKTGGRIAFGDFAKNFVKTGLTSGVEEGITEPTQNFWNDYIASITYDEQRELFTAQAAKQRLTESITAFSLGFLFGGGVSAVQTIEDNYKAGTAERYITTKEGQVMTEGDFNVLRKVKSDQDLIATAPDPETGKVLIAAANGDLVAQQEYNNRVLANAFTSADGLESDGLQIGKVDDVPAVTDLETGEVMVLDMNNPEARQFFDELKARAVSQEVAVEDSQPTIPGLEQSIAESAEIDETTPAQPVAAQNEPSVSSGIIAGSPVEAWADRTIREAGGRVNSGVDPALFAAYVVKGAAKFERNVRDFAAWSAEMVADFGETIKPQLKEIFDAIEEYQKNPKQFDAENVAQTVSKMVEAASIKQTGLPVTPQEVEFVTTGIPQNQTQATRAKQARINAKRLAASADLLTRLNTGKSLPARAKAVRRSADASLAAKLFVPLTTRLNMISKGLGSKLRRLDFDTKQAIYKDFLKAKEFQVGFEKMKPVDAEKLDFALKNGDVGLRDAVLTAYNLTSAFQRVEQVLADVRRRAVAVGYDVGQIENYFPRKVRDYEGLRQEYDLGPEGGIMDKRLSDAAKKAAEAGRVLSQEERENIISMVLRGTIRGDGKPANIKSRKTDILTVDASRYYADSMEALASYIESLNTAIEKRRFFGQSAVNVQAAEGAVNTQLAMESSVAAYVENLVATKQITRAQQNEVQQILEGRFKQGVASDFVRNFRSIAYMTTMGHLTSAVTQVTDLAFSMYENGVFDTMVAAGKAVKRNSDITIKQQAIDNIADEFRDQGKMEKAVNFVFKWVGIHYMDAVGKETLMNAKFRKMQREAISGQLSQRSQEIINAIYSPADAQRVITEIATGQKTQDSLFTVFSVLADYQPLTQSEYPEFYLRHPNGRIFYMLKMFTLKQFDVFRREAITKIVAGNAKEKMKGFSNLARLSGLLFLVGAPVDWLKDWMMGRDPQWTDIMVDNVFKMIGVNRYSLWQFRESKDPVRAALMLAAPPAPFLVYPVTDIFKSADNIAKGEDIEPGRFESWRMVPWLGSPYYWYFGEGEEKVERKAERRNKKESSGR